MCALLKLVRPHPLHLLPRQQMRKNMHMWLMLVLSPVVLKHSRTRPSTILPLGVWNVVIL